MCNPVKYSSVIQEVKTATTIIKNQCFNTDISAQPHTGYTDKALMQGKLIAVAYSLRTY